MNEQARMQELIEILTKAAESYYARDEEIISNYEYDKLYDELCILEEKTGIVLAGSPTKQVGYESVEFLPKEAHAAPMLSLGKTKSREELKEWVGEKEGLLSWKLDGLTVVLTYENGELMKAVTRGNGEIGEVVTNNARCFKNLPLHISCKGRLVLRGEAVISYPDFEKLNATIENAEEQYKNPRNLCSGSVRQLNNEVTAKRNVRFYAFTLVEAEGVDFHNSLEEKMKYLSSLGFDVVPYKRVNASNMEEMVEWFAQEIKTYEIPSDGLVLAFDDIQYGESLGRTAKFPRNAIAFKWADELRETTLVEIEWSPSRTGLINPVAIFEPVELEGTTVSRASVHNVSVMRSLKLGIGDRITVYKANMIIPQIAENLTGSNTVEIPKNCPACDGETRIEDLEGVQTLYCTNPDCPVKKIKALTLFVSREALNVDGLSEATIQKFTEKGFIKDYVDFFRLSRYREEIITMDGFGEKSYDNLTKGIEAASKTNLPRFLYGLGIANIGVATAKLICREFDYDLEALMHAAPEEISRIDNLGEVIAKSFCDYFASQENQERIRELLTHITLEIPKKKKGADRLKDLTFVVTGSLNHFHDRNELKEIVESFGGKVAGSVSAKTECLINNDATSSSSKNKKAKELEIPILDEEAFMAKYDIEGTI